MSNLSVLTDDLTALFYPVDANKNIRSSINVYLRWLENRGMSWINADVKDFRDYLLQGKWKDSTAKQHLARVRARYKDMLHNNQVRDWIQSRVPANATPADAFAITQEFLMRLDNNTQYDRVAIKLTRRRGIIDSRFHWLSCDDIRHTIESIPTNDLTSIRDRAMIALQYTYGLRVEEVCHVTIQDMLETSQGADGVLIRHGKGKSERFVRHEASTDLLDYVRDWTDNSGITAGLVLRSIGTNGKYATHKRIGTNAYRLRLREHGITFKPHDLRRSAARCWYDNERTVEYIMQQLGHDKPETTMLYLGLISE